MREMGGVGIERNIKRERGGEEGRRERARTSERFRFSMREMGGVGIEIDIEGERRRKKRGQTEREQVPNS